MKKSNIFPHKLAVLACEYDPNEKDKKGQYVRIYSNFYQIKPTIACYEYVEGTTYITSTNYNNENINIKESLIQAFNKKENILRNASIKEPPVITYDIIKELIINMFAIKIEDLERKLKSVENENKSLTSAQIERKYDARENQLKNIADAQMRAAFLKETNEDMRAIINMKTAIEEEQKKHNKDNINKNKETLIESKNAKK